MGKLSRAKKIARTPNKGDLVRVYDEIWTVHFVGDTFMTVRQEDTYRWVSIEELYEYSQFEILWRQ